MVRKSRHATMEMSCTKTPPPTTVRETAAGAPAMGYSAKYSRQNGWGRPLVGIATLRQASVAGIMGYDLGCVKSKRGWQASVD